VKVNSATSLISDICWAYAMLLTTPLIVTLGLSLTIPLSLVGQIILQAQYASPTYLVGATIVFLSFMVVNYESDGNATSDTRGADSFGAYEALAREEPAAERVL
jgi:solute carrier family 35, member F5